MADMVMMQGAISSIGTALNIAKGMYHLKASSDIQIKVIELNEAIITAQSSAMNALSEQFAMTVRVRDLEKEIADVKAWGDTKQRYQLIAPWDGCYVYALKELCKKTDPPHWICEHCYQDRRQSVLQRIQIWDRHQKTVLKCPHCSLELEVRDHSCPKYV